jgi:hypothetical protein
MNDARRATAKIADEQLTQEGGIAAGSLELGQLRARHNGCDSSAFPRACQEEIDTFLEALIRH